MVFVETYYVHLKFQAKTGSWSVNLPFVCDKCGVCCTLEDFLVAGEIQGSPEVNSKVYAEFKNLTVELGKLFEQDEKLYEQHIANSMCPFQIGSVCSIYAIRPKGCSQFPNTVFGMLSKDCRALDRFKKQKSALKKGRIVKEVGHFTVDKIKSVAFSKRQYDACVGKLLKVGITEEEMALFNVLNNYNV
jgi:Fe-S-cluster containining protein